MLPKKRPAEVIKLDDDSSSDNKTDNLHKKPRVGCLISSCSSINSRTTITGTADCDQKKSSGGVESNSNSSNSVVVEDNNSASNMGFEDGNLQEIDEDLHSRQLAVYGRETMRRLFASNVLISGMQGLGAEIGKIDGFRL